MRLAHLPFPITRFLQKTVSVLMTTLLATVFLKGVPVVGATPQDKTPPQVLEKSGGSTNLTADEYIRKAGAFSRLGDYTKAVSVLTTGLEQQPDASQLLFHRGNAYIQIAAAESRIKLCTREIAENPNAAPSFLHRAFAYYNTGNYVQAISDYTQAITRCPDYVAAYLGRGLAYTAMGRAKEGMGDYEKAIQLRPDLLATQRRTFLQAGYSLQRNNNREQL